MNSTLLRKVLLSLSLLMILAVACDTTVTVISPTSPAPIATNTPISSASTQEVVAAQTNAVPAEVKLNGMTLVVTNAAFAECDVAESLPAGAGRRYLTVPLQGVNVPADQALDYKQLPEGLAIRDNTGTITPFNRIYAYTPATHVITLYFAVPENATAFALQWPGAIEIPLLIVPHEAPTARPLVYKPVEVSQFQILVPPEVAGGIHGNQVPRADGADVPAWSRTPGHIEMQLESYFLQNRFHEPTIYVYPAMAYVEMVPAVFESIHRLDNIFGNPNAPIQSDQLPGIPFFNDQQVFAAQIKTISFQNGQGVRFVTQYAQHAASVNNHDLFYHFQGLTGDGQYYVVAILPVSHPMLAETDDPGAALPVGGVPYLFYSDPNADVPLYYKSVTEILNATPAKDFTPTLDQLDVLIQSMRVTS
jgi:hypothetical protein